MTSNERMREQSLASLGEFYAEGVEFLTCNTGRTRSHKESRKAKQLCRQVTEILDLVLSGDCRDELLQSLHVISVVPAPNSSRLLVTVSADLPIEEFDRQEILELLERQTGRLRCEVAASINRKRVPALVFHVVGPLSSLL
ncbi:MAG: ribosome-binding factor A [Planctomycetes bacterium]|nr:ribosome-binding factor A [Planctomycetota bacterium]